MATSKSPEVPLLPGSLLCMYVKNTFLEFANLDVIQEGGVSNDAQNADGADESLEVAGEVSGMRGLWKSMREEQRKRAKSNPARSGLDTLKMQRVLMGSDTSSQSSASQTFSEYSSSASQTRTHSPSSSGQSPSSNVTPRMRPGLPEEVIDSSILATSISDGQRETRKKLVNKQLVSHASKREEAPPAAPRPVEQGRKERPKEMRTRPPKPKRVRGKQLARMMYSVQDASDERREAAEIEFLQATAGDPLLYEYTMSVLNSMKQDDKKLNHLSERSEQEPAVVASQIAKGACVNPSVAHAAQPMGYYTAQSPYVSAHTHWQITSGRSQAR